MVGIRIAKSQEDDGGASANTDGMAEVAQRLTPSCGAPTVPSLPAAPAVPAVRGSASSSIEISR
jgi:hypothetical protein